jgi:hypothetical protein
MHSFAVADLLANLARPGLCGVSRITSQMPLSSGFLFLATQLSCPQAYFDVVLLMDRTSLAHY